MKDGVGPLLTAVEARGAATLLTAGVAALLPRTFVARPFFPRLPAVAVKIGLPAVRPSGHAETFARILRELARAERR